MVARRAVFGTTLGVFKSILLHFRERDDGDTDEDKVTGADIRVIAEHLGIPGAVIGFLWDGFNTCFWREKKQTHVTHLHHREFPMYN